MLDYDTILTSIGKYGFYQKRLFVYVLILAIPNGIHLTSIVFNNITPNFRCAVPGMTNDTFQIQNPSHRSLVEAFIPYDEENKQFSKCTVYDYSENSSFHVQDNDTHPCHRWVYEKDGSGLTLAVDFNLVCDRAIYKVHLNMFALLGVLLGSLIGGALSDRFGRKKAAVFGVVLQCIFAALYGLIKSIPLLMAVRVVLPILGSTMFLSVFVIMTETFGASKRGAAGLSTMFGFTAGLYMVALVNYFIRNWRTVQFVLSIPWISYILFWLVIQESPRWLLTRKRTEEAKMIMAYMAKVNGVPVPKELEIASEDTAELQSFNNVESDTGDDYSGGRGDGDDDGDGDGKTNTVKTVKEVKIWHICSKPRIAFRISILCFAWVTINMVYYGLILGVGDIIEGDIYVNFVLQTTMEAVSHVICCCILERSGRKKIFCANMMISGTALLGIAVLILTRADIRWLSLVLYCIGKLCITMAFVLVFIVTTELLPTTIRNSGLGFCSFVSRFSGIVVPYIVSASMLIPGPLGKAFPLLIFGAFTLLSGFSSFLLPETKDTILPETL